MAVEKCGRTFKQWQDGFDAGFVHHGFKLKPMDSFLV
jgi:hypothetical protein